MFAVRRARPGRTATPAKVEVAERRVNEGIKAAFVRLIDGDKNDIVPLRSAIAVAKSRGMQLVEMQADPEYPTCKVLDYVQYRKRGIEKKEASIAAAVEAENSATKIKGIRIGHNIADHDLQTKLKKLDEMLDKGALVAVGCTYEIKQSKWKKEYPLAVEVSKKIWERYNHNTVTWFDYNESGNKSITVMYTRAPNVHPKRAPFPWEGGSQPPPFMLAIQAEAAQRAQEHAAQIKHASHARASAGGGSKQYGSLHKEPGLRRAFSCSALVQYD